MSYLEKLIQTLLKLFTQAGIAKQNVDAIVGVPKNAYAGRFTGLHILLQ